MSLTRAQAKRAVEWEEFLAKPRTKRKDPPGCVTCGAKPTHDFARGEPAYACRHSPVRIDDAMMERARAEFGSGRGRSEPPADAGVLLEGPRSRRQHHPLRNGSEGGQGGGASTGRASTESGVSARGRAAAG